MTCLLRKTATAVLTAAAILSAGFAGAQAATQHYSQTNLVSDLPGMAAFTDPNLVNPWGLARSSSGPWWVSDNGPGLSTLYNGAGKFLPLVVAIPPSDPASQTGTPTGAVFNGGSGFTLAPGKPALFIFVTEDGTISGWNPGVNLGSAVMVVNEKQKSVFKGATIATVDGSSGGPASYLYVADFRRGRIRIYDTNFKPVRMDDEFEDDELPNGYAPFNVQNIGGNLYVTYGLQDAAKHDEVDGEGLGYVDVYSPTGKLLHRLEHGQWFNAPWGLAQASGDFGAFSHDILVGEFGSGEILAFDAVTGKFAGRLESASNQPIVIDGLWGLSFGNGATAGSATALYFSAGLNQEQDGLLGMITPIENAQGNDR